MNTRNTVWAAMAHLLMGTGRASLAGVHSHSKRDEEDRIKEIILSLLFF